MINRYFTHLKNLFLILDMLDLFMLNDIIYWEDFNGEVFVFLFMLTQVDSRKRSWNAAQIELGKNLPLHILCEMTPKVTIPHPGGWA